MKKNYQLRTSAIFLLFALVGCGGSTNATESASSAPPNACKSIPAQEKKVLIAKVADLVIGALQSQVESSLGKPGDTDHPLDKSSGKMIGTEYIYFVRKCGAGEHAGWDDDYVRLGFGTDGRLRLIEGIRVQGVVVRSAPLVD